LHFHPIVSIPPSAPEWLETEFRNGGDSHFGEKKMIKLNPTRVDSIGIQIDFLISSISPEKKKKIRNRFRQTGNGIDE